MSRSKGADTINYETINFNRCPESLQATPGHAVAES